MTIIFLEVFPQAKFVVFISLFLLFFKDIQELIMRLQIINNKIYIIILHFFRYFKLLYFKIRYYTQLLCFN